jgi:TPR repeat protein
MAAAAGDPRGMLLLAQMYAEGRGGLKRSSSQAKFWSKKAKNLGDN